jgi:hypothetical protein
LIKNCGLTTNNIYEFSFRILLLPEVSIRIFAMPQFSTKKFWYEFGEF